MNASIVIQIPASELPQIHADCEELARAYSKKHGRPFPPEMTLLILGPLFQNFVHEMAEKYRSGESIEVVE